MLLNAVLFDFDGVLARTMEDNERAWRFAVEPWIQDLGEEEYLLLEGLSPKGVAEALLGVRGLPLEGVPEIVIRKEQAYLRDHAFSLYPGIPELLDRLAVRLPLALVTGAARVRLEATLDPRVLRQFKAIVTADDQVSPKPSPEPYLKAAADLGVNPVNCLVVENAPLGIQSARAAGMVVVAVASTLAPIHLVGADHLVQDSQAMAALLGFLTQGVAP